ncbi:MAG: GIY-YIG nuclease family protein [Gammaproteobacteria bacterium]|nr:GIY-YIG nuclease family protein [Gammaproteobacteria bacterium]
MVQQFSRCRGSYLLLMVVEQAQPLKVGRWGTLQLQPGFYYYCGSAFGPGGVAARVGHHCRLSPRPRWHIDYLRYHMALKEVWYSCDPERREHHWAGVLARMQGVEVAAPGLGSSDCSCEAHLFYSRERRSFAGFRRRLLLDDPSHQPLCQVII